MDLRSISSAATALKLTLRCVTLNRSR